MPQSSLAATIGLHFFTPYPEATRGVFALLAFAALRLAERHHSRVSGGESAEALVEIRIEHLGAEDHGAEGVELRKGEAHAPPPSLGVVGRNTRPNEALMRRRSAGEEAVVSIRGSLPHCL